MEVNGSEANGCFGGPKGGNGYVPFVDVHRTIVLSPSQTIGGERRGDSTLNREGVGVVAAARGRNEQHRRGWMFVVWRDGDG